MPRERIPFNIGDKFGKLTVLEIIRPPNQNIRALVSCECGNVKDVFKSNLTSGITQSCGCLQKQRAADAQRKHGHAGRGQKDPTYKSWQSMWNRVLGHGDMGRHYEDRGISCCERWKSFENFLADMGERPDGLTLDRIDVNGNYEPSNCRWATKQQQMENRRPSKYTDEGRAKLSASRKLDWEKSRDGRLPARVVSEETREKMRASALARWHRELNS